ncbi:hypothetical protein Tco_0625465 [Tanacetum coccineum]|uniref:DUF4283 domain-containing protein n=1 Tax=Tanacetum coccineum TaxID=301880 RepID=A0ABQ4WGZ0_9ASTR
MLAVCNTDMSNLPKSPKPSSSAERVPQGTKPGAKPGYKKHSTSLTQPSVSSSEATKGGSSKRPTSSKTSHLKRKKESSSAMDSKPRQTSASTSVVAEMHKEDQQVAHRPTSLRVTSKERAYPQLSYGMSAFTFIEPVFSASYISHSESASGNDASADFTTEADPEISAPNDYVPHQQGPDEGSKYYTPDHTFVGTNPSILIYTTKSVGDGSQTVHSISGTKVDTRTAFRDDEHQDNEPFIALEESSEENVERNKDTHKLKQEKQKAAAKIATFKAQFVFPNINQLTEHLLKKRIKEFEIELPEVFNEILQKLKTFSSTFSSLTTQTLEALPGLLNKLTDTLNRFGSILNTHNEGVPSAGKSTALPAKGEKNTNPVTEDAELANLVDLIGIDVVEEYHKKKEDGSEEVISNLKTRVDQLTQTEQELKIDLNKPLKEQDPLNELNELANKKRKRASDFKTEEDLSKSFSPAWLTIPSWTMSISLTEGESRDIKLEGKGLANIWWWSLSGTDIQERDKKKAKNKQIRAQSRKDQVKSKSKVIHMKKIQLEGLKLGERGRVGGQGFMGCGGVAVGGGVMAERRLQLSVWMAYEERNKRIFKKKSRKVEQVRDVIITIVRLKIIALRFKKSLKVAKILDIWKTRMIQLLMEMDKSIWSFWFSVIGCLWERMHGELRMHALRMERGFLSSGGRRVKQKKNFGTCVDATHVDHNVMQPNRNVQSNSGNINDFSNINVRSNDVVTSSPNDIQHVVNAGTIYVSKIVDGGSGKLADVGAELDKNLSLNSSTTCHTSNGNNTGTGSFSKLFNATPTRKIINFCTLLAQAGNGVDVVISMESVRVAHERLSSFVYIFFMGKRFSSKDGMDAMIENGPWVICNVSLVMKKWTPDVNIMKEDVCNILVWVKFHDIPITAFTEDGLSTATKFHTPLMLDSCTSSMCTEPWVRSSYARAMVELRADIELKDTLVFVVLKFVGEGYTMSTIRVEYEWTPPRCSSCKVFSHVLDECPKKTIPDNGASSNGTKKQVGVARQELVEKEGNSDVVSSANGTSSKAFGSPNTTPLATTINDLEKQMLDEKLVLVDITDLGLLIYFLDILLPVILRLYGSPTGSLVAYSDTDWAGSPSTRRSTSGYCYRGVANVVVDTAWIRNLLRELHSSLLSGTLVYCDNVGVIYLVANPVHHQRAKHIVIDIHFVSDMVTRG